MEQADTPRWYYAANGQRVGPINDAALRALIAGAQLRPETFVWREGLTAWVAASSLPELAEALAAVDFRNVPPTSPMFTPAPEQPNAAEVLIPYRNGPALMGYYTSVFALIPGIGLILGPVAVVLGCMGRRNAIRNPGAKGTAHAWVAILLGGIITLLHIAGIVAMVFFTNR